MMIIVMILEELSTWVMFEDTETEAWRPQAVTGGEEREAGRGYLGWERSEYENLNDYILKSHK